MKRPWGPPSPLGARQLHFFAECTSEGLEGLRVALRSALERFHEEAARHARATAAMEHPGPQQQHEGTKRAPKASSAASPGDLPAAGFQQQAAAPESGGPWWTGSKADAGGKGACGGSPDAGGKGGKPDDGGKGGKAACGGCGVPEPPKARRRLDDGTGGAVPEQLTQAPIQGMSG